MYTNTNSVVEQAMKKYKDALRQSQEQLSADKLDHKEKIERDHWLDQQDVLRRRANMRANGQFIQEQIKAKREEDRKAQEAEQQLDERLRLDNIEYEKKIFAKHLCIPGSP